MYDKIIRQCVNETSRAIPHQNDFVSVYKEGKKQDNKKGYLR